MKLFVNRSLFLWFITVTASSLGVLFRGMGLRVTALKIDPYLNVDAGTMSPIEHGEVFVLDDGGECDLDLGNYERFLSVFLTRASNLSTGKIYQQVIERERVGEYLGKKSLNTARRSLRIFRCPLLEILTGLVTFNSVITAPWRAANRREVQSKIPNSPSWTFRSVWQATTGN